MARGWTDPRDGTIWWVNVVPFDAGPGGAAPSRTGWTLIFVSGTIRRDIPVGYQLGADVYELGDDVLIVLLDAARVDGG